MDDYLDASWALACTIYAEWLANDLITHPVPGVSYLHPVEYATVHAEQIYFSRRIIWDD